MTYVGNSGQLVTIWEGSANGVAYSSGITHNHDIAMTAVGFAIRFTECCQPMGGGALGNYTPFNPIVEYSLPYTECWSPAGIAFDYTLVYIPCAGRRDALLVTVDERSRRTGPVPFPGRYRSRVNSVVFGTDGNLYFATGAGSRLVRYDTVRKKLCDRCDARREHTDGDHNRRLRIEQPAFRDHEREPEDSRVRPAIADAERLALQYCGSHSFGRHGTVIKL